MTNKSIDEEIKKLNILLSNPTKNEREICELLTNIIKSGKKIKFVQIQKCQKCNNSDINKHYITLDCLHKFDSDCIIELYKKPSHYRLQKECILKLNITCPIEKCNSKIDIKKLIEDKDFSKRLLENRFEYEDEKTFYCDILLEKIDNSYKLELPCGAIINIGMFLEDFKSKVFNFEEIKCNICNEKIILEQIKDHLLDSMNIDDRKDFENLLLKYYELEVFEVMKDKESLCFYCPNVKCAHFLTFLSLDTKHATNYCYFCCEPLCLDCKSLKDLCVVEIEKNLVKTLINNCKKNHKISFEFEDEEKHWKSLKCENCNVVKCGFCNSIFSEDYFKFDHIH